MNKHKYKYTIPPTDEQGSYSTIANSDSDALWDYNSARAHDGLPPIKSLPKGTKRERIYE
jgi:hypothetical protein